MPLEGDINFPAWSNDSQFIYSLLTTGDALSALVRVHVKTKKVERIFDLKDWHLTGWAGFSLTLDPTDAPLVLREMGSNDIYSLTLEVK